MIARNYLYTRGFIFHLFLLFVFFCADGRYAVLVNTCLVYLFINSTLLKYA